MNKKERTLTRHPEELPATAEYGPRWIYTATEGTISSAKWSYDWNQIRAKWHPQYFFRWNDADARYWDDNFTHEGYQIPMEPPKDICVIDGMFHPSGKQTTDSQTSDDTDNRNDRRRCTIFLIAIGILLIAAVAIPLSFFILSLEARPNDIVGRVNAELTLVKINFVEQMLNKSSVEYKVLSRIFESEISNLYGNSTIRTNYRRCQVISLAQGSVNVNYNMFFDVIERRLPTSDQMRDVLYSVERDKNDTTLGVLGDLRFRIDTVKLIETTTVLKKKIDEKSDTNVIVGIKDVERAKEKDRQKDDSDTTEDKKINIHNILADIEPNENVTKNSNTNISESKENTTVTHLIETTPVMETREITEQNKNISSKAGIGSFPPTSSTTSSSTETNVTTNLKKHATEDNENITNESTNIHNILFETTDATTFQVRESSISTEYNETTFPSLYATTISSHYTRDDGANKLNRLANTTRVKELNESANENSQKDILVETTDAFGNIHIETTSQVVIPFQNASKQSSSIPEITQEMPHEDGPFKNDNTVYSDGYVYDYYVVTESSTTYQPDATTTESQTVQGSMTNEIGDTVSNERTTKQSRMRITENMTIAQEIEIAPQRTETMQSTRNITINAETDHVPPMSIVTSASTDKVENETSYKEHITKDIENVTTRLAESTNMNYTSSTKKDITSLDFTNLSGVNGSNEIVGKEISSLTEELNGTMGAFGDNLIEHTNYLVIPEQNSSKHTSSKLPEITKEVSHEDRSFAYDNTDYTDDYVYDYYAVKESSITPQQVATVTESQSIQETKVAQKIGDVMPDEKTTKQSSIQIKENKTVAQEIEITQASYAEDTTQSSKIITFNADIDTSPPMSTEKRTTTNAAISETMSYRKHTNKDAENVRTSLSASTNKNTYNATTRSTEFTNKDTEDATTRPTEPTNKDTEDTTIRLTESVKKVTDNVTTNLSESMNNATDNVTTRLPESTSKDTDNVTTRLTESTYKNTDNITTRLTESMNNVTDNITTRLNESTNKDIEDVTTRLTESMSKDTVNVTSRIFESTNVNDISSVTADEKTYLDFTRPPKHTEKNKTSVHANSVIKNSENETVATINVNASNEMFGIERSVTYILNGRLGDNLTENTKNLNIPVQNSSKHTSSKLSEIEKEISNGDILFASDNSVYNDGYVYDYYGVTGSSATQQMVTTITKTQTSQGTKDSQKIGDIVRDERTARQSIIPIIENTTVPQVLGSAQRTNTQETTLSNKNITLNAEEDRFLPMSMPRSDSTGKVGNTTMSDEKYTTEEMKNVSTRQIEPTSINNILSGTTHVNDLKFTRPSAHTESIKTTEPSNDGFKDNANETVLLLGSNEISGEIASEKEPLNKTTEAVGDDLIENANSLVIPVQNSTKQTSSKDPASKQVTPPETIPFANDYAIYNDDYIYDYYATTESSSLYQPDTVTTVAETIQESKDAKKISEHADAMSIGTGEEKKSNISSVPSNIKTLQLTSNTTFERRTARKMSVSSPTSMGLPVSDIVTDNSSRMSEIDTYNLFTSKDTTRKHNSSVGNATHGDTTDASVGNMETIDSLYSFSASSETKKSNSSDSENVTIDFFTAATIDATVKHFTNSFTRAKDKMAKMPEITGWATTDAGSSPLSGKSETPLTYLMVSDGTTLGPVSVKSHTKFAYKGGSDRTTYGSISKEIDRTTFGPISSTNHTISTDMKGTDGATLSSINYTVPTDVKGTDRATLGSISNTSDTALADIKGKDRTTSDSISSTKDAWLTYMNGTDRTAFWPISNTSDTTLTDMNYAYRTTLGLISGKTDISTVGLLSSTSDTSLTDMKYTDKTTIGLISSTNDVSFTDIKGTDKTTLGLIPNTTDTTLTDIKSTGRKTFDLISGTTDKSTFGSLSSTSDTSVTDMKYTDRRTIGLISSINDETFTDIKGTDKTTLDLIPNTTDTTLTDMKSTGRTTFDLTSGTTDIPTFGPLSSTGVTSLRYMNYTDKTTIDLISSTNDKTFTDLKGTGTTTIEIISSATDTPLTDIKGTDRTTVGPMSSKSDTVVTNLKGTDITSLSTISGANYTTLAGRKGELRTTIGPLSSTTDTAFTNMKDTERVTVGSIFDTTIGDLNVTTTTFEPIKSTSETIHLAENKGTVPEPFSHTDYTTLMDRKGIDRSTLAAVFDTNYEPLSRTSEKPMSSFVDAESTTPKLIYEASDTTFLHFYATDSTILDRSIYFNDTLDIGLATSDNMTIENITSMRDTSVQNENETQTKPVLDSNKKIVYSPDESSDKNIEVDFNKTHTNRIYDMFLKNITTKSSLLFMHPAGVDNDDIDNTTSVVSSSDIPIGYSLYGYTDTMSTTKAESRSPSVRAYKNKNAEVVTKSGIPNADATNLAKNQFTIPSNSTNNFATAKRFKATALDRLRQIQEDNITLANDVQFSNTLFPRSLNRSYITNNQRTFKSNDNLDAIYIPPLQIQNGSTTQGALSINAQNTNEKPFNTGILYINPLLKQDVVTTTKTGVQNIPEYDNFVDTLYITPLPTEKDQTTPSKHERVRPDSILNRTSNANVSDNKTNLLHDNKTSDQIYSESVFLTSTTTVYAESDMTANVGKGFPEYVDAKSVNNTGSWTDDISIFSDITTDENVSVPNSIFPMNYNKTTKTKQTVKSPSDMHAFYQAGNELPINTDYSYLDNETDIIYRTADNQENILTTNQMAQTMTGSHETTDINNQTSVLSLSLTKNNYSLFNNFTPLQPSRNDEPKTEAVSSPTSTRRASLFPEDVTLNVKSPEKQIISKLFDPALRSNYFTTGVITTRTSTITPASTSSNLEPSTQTSYQEVTRDLTKGRKIKFKDQFALDNVIDTQTYTTTPFGITHGFLTDDRPRSVSTDTLAVEIETPSSRVTSITPMFTRSNLKSSTKTSYQDIKRDLASGGKIRFKDQFALDNVLDTQAYSVKPFEFTQGFQTDNTVRPVSTNVDELSEEIATPSSRVRSITLESTTSYLEPSTQMPFQESTRDRQSGGKIKVNDQFALSNLQDTQVYSTTHFDITHESVTENIPRSVSTVVDTLTEVMIEITTPSTRVTTITPAFTRSNLKPSSKTSYQDITPDLASGGKIRFKDQFALDNVLDTQAYSIKPFDFTHGFLKDNTVRPVSTNVDKLSEEIATPSSRVSSISPKSTTSSLEPSIQTPFQESTRDKQLGRKMKLNDQFALSNVQDTQAYSTTPFDITHEFITENTPRSVSTVEDTLTEEKVEITTPSPRVTSITPTSSTSDLEPSTETRENTYDKASDRKLKLNDSFALSNVLDTQAYSTTPFDITPEFITDNRPRSVSTDVNVLAEVLANIATPSSRVTSITPASTISNLKPSTQTPYQESMHEKSSGSKLKLNDEFALSNVQDTQAFSTTPIDITDGSLTDNISRSVSTAVDTLAEVMAEITTPSSRVTSITQGSTTSNLEPSTQTAYQESTRDKPSGRKTKLKDQFSLDNVLDSQAHSTTPYDITHGFITDSRPRSVATEVDTLAEVASYVSNKFSGFSPADSGTLLENLTQALSAENLIPVNESSNTNSSNSMQNAYHKQLATPVKLNATTNNELNYLNIGKNGPLLKDYMSKTVSTSNVKSNPGIQETVTQKITSDFQYLWNLGESDVLQKYSTESAPLFPATTIKQSRENETRTSGINKDFRYLWNLGESVLLSRDAVTFTPTSSSIPTMKETLSPLVTTKKPSTPYKPDIRYLWSLGNNILSTLLRDSSVKQPDTGLKEKRIIGLNNTFVKPSTIDKKFRTAGMSVFEPKDVFLPFNPADSLIISSNPENQRLPTSTNPQQSDSQLSRQKTVHLDDDRVQVSETATPQSLNKLNKFLKMNLNIHKLLETIMPRKNITFNDTTKKALLPNEHGPDSKLIPTGSHELDIFSKNKSASVALKNKTKENISKTASIENIRETQNHLMPFNIISTLAGLNNVSMSVLRKILRNTERLNVSDQLLNNSFRNVFDKLPSVDFDVPSAQGSKYYGHSSNKTHINDGTTESYSSYINNSKISEHILVPDGHDINSSTHLPNNTLLRYDNEVLKENWNDYRNTFQGRNESAFANDNGSLNLLHSTLTNLRRNEDHHLNRDKGQFNAMQNIIRNKEDLSVTDKNISDRSFESRYTGNIAIKGGHVTKFSIKGKTIGNMSVHISTNEDPDKTPSPVNTTYSNWELKATGEDLVEETTRSVHPITSIPSTLNEVKNMSFQNKARSQIFHSEFSNGSDRSLTNSFWNASENLHDYYHDVSTRPSGLSNSNNTNFPGNQPYYENWNISDRIPYGNRSNIPDQIQYAENTNDSNRLYLGENTKKFNQTSYGRNTNVSDGNQNGESTNVSGGIPYDGPANVSDRLPFGENQTSFGRNVNGSDWYQYGKIMNVSDGISHGGRSNVSDILPFGEDLTPYGGSVNVSDEYQYGEIPNVRLSYGGVTNVSDMSPYVENTTESYWSTYGGITNVSQGHDYGENTNLSDRRLTNSSEQIFHRERMSISEVFPYGEHSSVSQTQTYGKNMTVDDGLHYDKDTNVFDTLHYGKRRNGSDRHNDINEKMLDRNWSYSDSISTESLPYGQNRNLSSTLSHILRTNTPDSLSYKESKHVTGDIPLSNDSNASVSLLDDTNTNISEMLPYGEKTNVSVGVSNDEIKSVSAEHPFGEIMHVPAGLSNSKITNFSGSVPFDKAESNFSRFSLDGSTNASDLDSENMTFSERISYGGKTNFSEVLPFDGKTNITNSLLYGKGMNSSASQHHSDNMSITEKLPVDTLYNYDFGNNSFNEYWNNFSDDIRSNETSLEKRSQANDSTFNRHARNDYEVYDNDVSTVFNVSNNGDNKDNKPVNLNVDTNSLLINKTDKGFVIFNNTTPSIKTDITEMVTGADNNTNWYWYWNNSNNNINHNTYYNTTTTAVNRNQSYYESATVNSFYHWNSTTPWYDGTTAFSVESIPDSNRTSILSNNTEFYVERIPDSNKTPVLSNNTEFYAERIPDSNKTSKLSNYTEFYVERTPDYNKTSILSNSTEYNSPTTALPSTKMPFGNGNRYSDFSVNKNVKKGTSENIFANKSETERRIDLNEQADQDNSNGIGLDNVAGIDHFLNISNRFDNTVLNAGSRTNIERNRLTEDTSLPDINIITDRGNGLMNLTSVIPTTSFPGNLSEISNNTGDPYIQYWQSGDPFIGSALSMAWNAVNIGGWTYIVLKRELSNGKTEMIASIRAETMAITYGNSSLFVSPQTVFDGVSATIYLDIRTVKCQDEAVYTLLVSNDVGEIQRLVPLQVLREPTVKIDSPRQFFSDESLESVKCKSDIGFPYGKIVMRISYSEREIFENYFVQKDMIDIQTSGACQKVVSVNFTGYFNRRLQKNLTRIQCGVYDSKGIKSSTGYIMSEEETVKIIPADVCESKGLQLVPHPYDTCWYIECPQRRVKKCPVGTCFDTKLRRCR